MIRKVPFPKIDANIEEATITLWHRCEGDRVQKGEPLLEITTDKGVIDVEAPAGGILRRIVAPVSSTVPVGYVLALIGDAAEPLPDVDTANRALLQRHRAAATGAAGRTPAAAPAGAVRATPAARRLARDKGIDLAAVQAALKVEVVDERAVAAFAARRKG
jgi:pyruvate dehydrogenase E2 component (dihydrolipoamide acetyltransferase)